MKIGVFASTENDKYVFKTLFDTLGIDYQFVNHKYENCDIVISHGENVKGVNSINILNSAHKEPAVEWIEHNNHLFPVFFSSVPPTDGQMLYYYRDRKKPAISYTQERGQLKIVVGPDMIASAYYLLTLLYESKPNFEPTLLKRPLVTEYMLLLLDLIRFLSRKLEQPILQKWYWPNNKSFAVCLTHDIDFIKLWWITSLTRTLELMRHRKFYKILKLTAKAINAAVKGKNPFVNFEKFIQLEKEKGFKSSFFFLTDGGSLKNVIRNRGGTYYPEEVMNIIQKTALQGWDVGLHGSINSYNDYAKLSSEKKKLEEILKKPTFGIRQHFIRLSPPSTWKIQEKCGFLFDTTLAYPHLPGFRGGFSFPFYPYDESNKRQLDILEIPLNVMDRTFTKYELRSNPVDIVETFFHAVRELGGLVTILWHNSSVDEGGFQGYFEMYKKILDLIKSSGGYGVSARELTEWWTARRDLKLVKFENKAKSICWTFCPNRKIPALTFKIYFPKKEFKQVIVDGAASSVEFLDELIIVNVQGITQDKVINIRMRKE